MDAKNRELPPNIFMKELYDLLYGEGDIVYKVHSGNEDEVTDDERNELIRLSKETNLRLKEGKATVEELLMYIDMMETFQLFNHVDWISDIIMDVCDNIKLGVDYTRELRQY